MNIIAPIAHPRLLFRRHWRRTACAIFAVAVALLSSPVIAQEDDLTGPAWNLADRAYRAYEAGDYKRAVEAARDAVALRPDLPRLRVLLVNSLVAAGDLTGAVAAADQALAAGIANDELRITRDRLKRTAAPQTGVTAPVDPAFAAADAGYKAFARRDYAAAIASARQAVALDPASDGYRLLLINALTADNRIAEAESAASEALTRSPDAAGLRLQRGYLRQRLRRWGAALDDLSRALQQAGLTAEQKRSASLALADVALAAKNPKRSLDALSPLALERSYDVAARRGFALQALGRQDEALAAFTLALANTTKSSERASMIRGVVAALVALERRDEAKERFTAALSSADLNDLKHLDIAYLANQVGDDRTADDYFSRADSSGQLQGKALLDAAYAAKRQFDNMRAESLFRRRSMRTRPARSPWMRNGCSRFGATSRTQAASGVPLHP
jgi:tetratricopeptide (TPR) repeat protein